MTNTMIEAIDKTMRAKWVYWLLFECFVFRKYKNLTFHLPWLSIKPKQLGVRWISKLSFLNIHTRMACGWILYIKGPSWKRCYLVKSSRLIHVYFIVQESLNRNQKVEKSLVFFSIHLVLFQIRNSDSSKAHGMMWTIWSAFLC